MDTRTVSQGSLNSLAVAIHELSGTTEGIRSLTRAVDNKAVQIEDQIQNLQQEFTAFQDFDNQQKELSQAKTRIVEVNQKLQATFGANETVRQYMTGILEATDLSLVRQSVITNVTERVMLQCPTYWLAPCLVALSAWMGNNQPLAGRALSEAIRRDDEKTSILFALICRRFGRMNASAAWLGRYLQVQDPRQMERKMVTVLDAYSNGLFGPQARSLCAERIRSWIEELSQEPGFVEKQQKSWEESMYSKVPANVDSNQYPLASKHAKNWNEVQSALNENALYGVLRDYFRDIFEKAASSTASLNSRLDELLETYVSSYDNEELPYRKEERLLKLIIEARGRKSVAQARFQAEEKALDEVIDFTQLLTNAAMHADVIKASNATQRLAVGLSLDWVSAGLNNIQAEIRSRIPDRFQVEVEGWTGDIEFGDDEKALVEDAKQHFKKRRDDEIAAVKQSRLDMILPIVVAGAAVFTLFRSLTWGIVLLLSAAGLGLRWYLNRKNCEQRRQNIKKAYNEKFKKITGIIQGLCRERDQFIEEIKARDAVSEELCDYLSSVDAGQYAPEAGK